MEPAATVHPYTVRLIVDLDPAGNAIGAALVYYRRGEEVGTIHTWTPAPFDGHMTVFTELIDRFESLIGRLPTLW